MNKKLIRLTESDLHKVIKESVNKVLTELDWKTYANAEKKMRERGADYWERNGEKFPDTISKAANARIRAERLGNAAMDAFDSEYGYKQGDWRDGDQVEVGMGGDFGSTEEFGPHAAVWKHNAYLTRQFPLGYTMARTPEEFLDGNPYADDAINAYNMARGEIRNYKSGKYSYEPNGRGWHLKDDMD